MHAFEFLVDVEGRSQIDDMFADTWNHLHRTVIENIHLYHLILPELVLQQGVAYQRQGLLGIFP